MARTVATLVLCLTLACPGCGRKGPLELPPGRGPLAVEGLKAVQRGDRVVLEWTTPTRTVSGRPLVGARIEVRAVEAPSLAALRGVDADERGAVVATIAPGQPPEGVYEHGFDPRRAGSVAFAFSVRVRDGRGRASAPSAPAAVETRPCPLPPVLKEVRVFPELLEIAWEPPAANIDGSSPAAVAGYAVFRREGDGRPERRTPRPIEGMTFEDRDFRFGAAYAYTVRSVSAEGVESADAEPAAVEPRDIFAPAPPSGLAGVAGPEGVSLSWAPSREPDLAGYTVWRKTDNEMDFSPLSTGLVRRTTFTDPSVRKGAAYAYAVSASDLNGNESARSAPVTLTAKGGRP